MLFALIPGASNYLIWFWDYRSFAARSAMELFLFFKSQLIPDISQHQQLLKKEKKSTKKKLFSLNSLQILLFSGNLGSKLHNACHHPGTAGAGTPGTGGGYWGYCRLCHRYYYYYYNNPTVSN